MTANESLSAEGTVMQPPFSLELTTGDGSQLKFTERSVFLSWAQKEIEMWQGLAARCRNIGIVGVNGKQLSSEINTYQVAPINNIISHLDDPAKLPEALNRLNSYISAVSLKGELILETAETSLISAASLLAAWNTKILSIHVALQSATAGDANGIQLFHGHLNGIINAYLFDRGVSTAEDEKNALQDIRNTLTNLHLDYKGSLEKLAEENRTAIARSHEGYKQKETAFEKDRTDYKEKTDLQFEELKKDLEAVRKLYKEELSLKAPITYWTKRARDHEIKVSIWAIAFVGSIAGFFLFSPEIFTHINTLASGLQPVVAYGPALPQSAQPW